LDLRGPTSKGREGRGEEGGRGGERRRNEEIALVFHCHFGLGEGVLPIFG